MCGPSFPPSLPLIIIIHVDSRLVRSSCDDIDCDSVFFDRTYYSSEGKSADEVDRWVVSMSVYKVLFQLTLPCSTYPTHSSALSLPPTASLFMSPDSCDEYFQKARQVTDSSAIP
jgi:hypothetical protein